MLPGEVAQILIMTNNITTLSYTHAKLRIKNPPDILCEIAHIGRLIEWISSRLAWTYALLGRDLSLVRPSTPKDFTETNNQEGLTAFDTSKWYTL